MINFTTDNPTDCAYCRFWKGRYRGCTAQTCDYQNPQIHQNPEKTSGGCEDCPYGRHSPCIGFCLKRILEGKSTYA